MSHERTIATTIFNYAKTCDDYDVLTRLSEMSWSLKPLIERGGSDLTTVLGQELWMYVGVKRDANPEMSEDYALSIEKLLAESGA